jgi:hypothetical protein
MGRIPVRRYRKEVPLIDWTLLVRGFLSSGSAEALVWGAGVGVTVSWLGTVGCMLGSGGAGWPNRTSERGRILASKTSTCSHRRTLNQW